MTIADQIRTLRVTRNKTLKDVSIGTGLSVSYLSDLERGRTEPSIKTLNKLAQFHGCTLEIEFVQDFTHEHIQ